MRSRANVKSHPIHPMLVVFPLGLWIAGFIFDLAGVWRDQLLLWSAGYYAILGGVIGAALAAVPGAIDLFGSVPARSSARTRGYLHGVLNALALVLFLYLVLRRDGPGLRPEATVLWLEALGVAGVIFSSWLGGTLVYRNQIGVDHRYANAGKSLERTLDSWERPVANQAELAEGQMMLAHIQGYDIVVGRCSEGIKAFSNRCTHKGGPLSDGALVGCVVQCPWHGTQFDIRNGRVVAGPAKHHIETYSIEVRQGEIYIQQPTEESEIKPTKRERVA